MIDDSFVKKMHLINTEPKWHSLHSKAAALLSFNSTHLIWHNCSCRCDCAGWSPILHITAMISSVCCHVVYYTWDLRPCISRTTHPWETHCFFVFFSCLHHKKLSGSLMKLQKCCAQLAVVDRVAEGKGDVGTEGNRAGAGDWRLKAHFTETPSAAFVKTWWKEIFEPGSCHSRRSRHMTRSTRAEIQSQGIASICFLRGS